MPFITPKRRLLHSYRLIGMSDIFLTVFINFSKLFFQIIIMKKPILQLSIITFLFSLSIFAQDLNIAASGHMYISPTAFVHASSNVNIDSSGDLIMDSVSNDFSDLFVAGTSTGNAEYRRFTASSDTRDLVSPPVSSQAFNLFATANSGKIATGTITPANLMYGPFNKSTGLYEEYASTDATPLAAGKGYRAGSVSGETLTYSGVVQTADTPLSLSLGSAGFKETSLVGNPFTTHIHAGAIVTALGASTAIDPSYAAIYGYDGEATTEVSSWKVINSFSSSELITPGQGFIIISSAAGGSFTIPKSARRVSAIAQDDFITGRQALPSSFKLKLYKGSNIFETSLYFIDANGSRGLDVTYDAGSLGSDIGTHLVENSQGGVNLAIQALSTADLTATDYVIPVEVSVAAGLEATISVDDLNVPSGTEFFLHDYELNTQTRITSDDYTFTPTSDLSGVGRFYLSTTSETFSNEGLSALLYSVEVSFIRSTKKLLVQGQLRSDYVLKLIDMKGSVVREYHLKASQTKHEIDVSDIESAVYVAILGNNDQSKATKLIIN